MKTFDVMVFSPSLNQYVVYTENLIKRDAKDTMCHLRKLGKKANMVTHKPDRHVETDEDLESVDFSELELRSKKTSARRENQEDKWETGVWKRESPV